MNCQTHHYRGQDPTNITRRWFFRDCAVGLEHRPGRACWAATPAPRPAPAGDPLAPKKPHFPAKAKRVVYLFMAGAPSHLELFDYKPQLAKFDGTLPPPELIQGYRAAFISPNSKLLGPQVQVRQTRPMRGGVVRIAARTWRAWPTTSPSSSRWSPTPSTTRRRRS